MSNVIFGTLILLIGWGGFAIMVWHDPMAVCGIFFPLAITGQALDVFEGN